MKKNDLICRSINKQTKKAMENLTVNGVIESGLIASSLETTDLNWHVTKQPIQTTSGIEIPNKIALVRSDNSAILGIHSTSYHPYQNEQMLELLYKISFSTGLKIHSSGMFGNGEKVFIQLKSDNHKMGNTWFNPKTNKIESDEIKGYFTAINSFDGSKQFGFGQSHVTISCLNTFTAAYREVQTKLKHTINMQFKIDDMLKQIDILRKEEQKHFETIERMFQTPLTEHTKSLTAAILFDLSIVEKLAYDEIIHIANKQTILKRDSTIISSIKANKILKFNSDLLRETKEKGQNLWGLFSGVTRYTTHSALNEDSTENKLFGSLGNRERKVFTELSKIV